MSNDRIRISYTEYYPMANGNCSRFPNLHVSPGCPRPGIAVELITLLTTYLNLTIDVKMGPNSVDDESYMFDELDSNKTDLYALLTQHVPILAIKYDLTEEIYPKYIKVAVRRTDHSFKSIFDFFNMYGSDVWISMIVVFVLFTVFGLLVRYVECQLMLRERWNFVEILWKMIRVQLVQSEGIDYNLIAGRSSLLVFSFFQICIILGLFQGFILTSIIKKVHPVPFTSNNFFQLVREKKLTIVLPLISWVRDEIETSHESAFYELREAFKSNPYKIVEDAKRAVDEGEGNGSVAIVDEPKWQINVAESERYCNLVLVDVLIRPRPQRFFFKKGSRFVPMFNRAINANRYLIERIYRKYFIHRPPSKCTTQNTGPTSLSITPYYGLLILFFAGMSSACFVFSGELLKWKMSRALMSGSDGATEGASNSAGNSAVTAVDTPMSSEQSILPTAGGDGNSLTLSAEVVATFIAATGLPPGTKLYALMLKIGNREISYRIRLR